MNVTSMNVTINLDDKDASVKGASSFYTQFKKKASIKSNYRKPQ